MALKSKAIILLQKQLNFSLRRFLQIYIFTILIFNPVK